LLRWRGAMVPAWASESTRLSDYLIDEREREHTKHSP
jgi:hypothetical protein